MSSFRYGISYLAKTFTTDVVDIMMFGLHIVTLVANNGLWDQRVGGPFVDIDVLIAIQVTLLWAKLPYFFRYRSIRSRSTLMVPLWMAIVV